jgi:sugar-phosphatase
VITKAVTSTYSLSCEAILFDLDGVLIDSTSCIRRHWEAWTRRHGLDTEALMQTAHGLRTIETMQRAAPHLDVQKEAEQFEALEIADTDGVVPINGALHILEKLPPHAWAVVTSGGRNLARARLKRAGLPVPATLISGDMVKQGKPAPEPYLLASTNLGVAVEDCVVIEDSPAGIASAKAAGMRVIAIASTHSRQVLGCEIVVRQLSELTIRMGNTVKIQFADISSG